MKFIDAADVIKKIILDTEEIASKIGEPNEGEPEITIARSLVRSRGYLSIKKIIDELEVDT